MNQLIAYNNTIIPVNEIPFNIIENRSFQYGDGTFETIKILHGIPFHLKSHILRLENGLKALKIEVNTKEIKDSIYKLIEALNLTSHGIIKLQVFRNQGGKYIPHSNKGSYIISIENQNNSYELNIQGWTTKIFHDTPVKKTAFSGFKSPGQHCYIQAGIYTKEQLIDHCILLDERGYLCEGLSSNLFLVKNGAMYTPKNNTGNIPGIMQSIITKIANKAGIEVYQANILPEDLISYDELFFTNVNTAIRWVLAYEGKRFVNTTSKKLLRVLNEQIEQNINAITTA